MQCHYKVLTAKAVWSTEYTVVQHRAGRYTAEKSKRRYFCHTGVDIEQKNFIPTYRKNTGILSKYRYVTGHEKIGLMCTQNLTTFLNFKLQ